MRWAWEARWCAAAQENAENESESEICYVYKSEYLIEKWK